MRVPDGRRRDFRMQQRALLRSTALLWPGHRRDHDPVHTGQTPYLRRHIVSAASIVVLTFVSNAEPRAPQAHSSRPIGSDLAGLVSGFDAIIVWRCDSQSVGMGCARWMSLTLKDDAS